MTYLVFFLTIGLLLFILLVLWLRRGSTLARGGEPSGAVQDLNELELELPPQTLVERLFALQDWEYVSRQAPPQIRRLFLRERRSIALSWLRDTRGQAVHLVGFYLRVVRRNASLKPGVELRLAFRYALFLLESGALSLWIRLGGTFYSRKMVGYAVSVSQQLSYILGQVLGSMNTARIGRMGTD